MEDTLRFRLGFTADFARQAPGAAESAIVELLPEVDWEMMADTGAAARADVVDRYDGILALGLRFPRESLAKLDRTVIIARWGVGYDRIDVDACTEAGVIVAITPGAVRRPVAEGILAYVFALAKQMHALDAQIRLGRWRTPLPDLWNIEGKTLGSVGAGNIARELFRLARPLGFGRLLATDPYAPSTPEGVEAVDLDTLLRESDFVVINCPLTVETRRRIGAREIALMKPTAFLINTARGPIVDERALVAALRSRAIAGAGLDVFETEPVEADNPLLGLDNVILSPHAIAWTRELHRDNSLEACRNIREVSEGRIPEHVVNREAIARPRFQAKLARWRRG